MTPTYHQYNTKAPGKYTDDRRPFRWRAMRAFAVAMLFLIAACGSTEIKLESDRPPETLYNQGMALLTGGEGDEAIRFFNEVERQHPYSVWANKAMLMGAYTNYAMNRYTEAIVGLDRFIRLHPGSRDISYAYYLKALSYYEQIGDVRRDQGTTRQAMASLQEVIRRHPKTRYARDARLKYDLTRDQLAGQEMSVGRWYQTRGQFISAINRFKRVIEVYQTTSHAPEALHRLTEAYLALGLKDEAQKTAAVLGHNYPNSEWYMDSYSVLTGKNPRRAQKSTIVGRRSWWGRTWNSIF
jgi:outer membrane protein assembly factor BamD